MTLNGAWQPCCQGSTITQQQEEHQPKLGGERFKSPQSVYVYLMTAKSHHPSSSVSESAIKLVQQQLDAYNRRDIDAWLATYSEDAEQFLLHTGSIAKGAEEIRKRMEDRFKDTALHAELVHRICVDNIVVDHEVVTRIFPDGLGSIEMICLYEVVEGKIAKATFSFGRKSMLPIIPDISVTKSTSKTEDYSENL